MKPSKNILEKVVDYLFPSSHTPHQPREEYYHGMLFFKRIVRFYNLIQQKQLEGEIRTSIETINPIGLQLEASLPSVESKWNKPLYTFDLTDTYKVLLYKKQIAGKSLYIQLQFFEKQLFFIAISNTVFLKTEEQKTEMINSILLKYLSVNYRTGQPLPYIKDSSENFVLVDDDVHFSICFLHKKFMTHTMEKLEPLLQKAAISSHQKTQKEDHA